MSDASRRGELSSSRALRYYRRPWDESRGDAYDAWGPSVWYFEVGDDGYPTRQVETYLDGHVLRYDSAHIEDEYGALGDQPIHAEEFAPFEVTKELFEAAWSSSPAGSAGKESDDLAAGAGALEAKLNEMGVGEHAARSLVAAASRASGMVAICGPAGAGKTRVGELLARGASAALLEDLRTFDDVAAGLTRAAHGVVVGVVRSGESHGLLQRWRDMGLAGELVEAAAVTTATLRRLPANLAPEAGTADLLLVEVLAPDQSLLTGSLAEEARALVASGRVRPDVARFHVPGYE